MKSPIYFIYYIHIYVIWRYPVGDITPWRIAMSICLSEISLSIWIRIVSVSCFQFSSPFLSLCLSLLLLLSSIPAFANVRQLPWLPLIQPSHSYFTCSCYIGSAFVYVLFALHSNGFGIHRSPGSAPRCQGMVKVSYAATEDSYGLLFSSTSVCISMVGVRLSLSFSLSRFLYLCVCVCVCVSFSLWYQPICPYWIIEAYPCSPAWRTPMRTLPMGIRHIVSQIQRHIRVIAG